MQSDWKSDMPDLYVYCIKLAFTHLRSKRQGDNICCTFTNKTINSKFILAKVCQSGLMGPDSNYWGERVW